MFHALCVKPSTISTGREAIDIGSEAKQKPEG